VKMQRDLRPLKQQVREERAHSAKLQAEKRVLLELVALNARLEPDTSPPDASVPNGSSHPRTVVAVLSPSCMHCGPLAVTLDAVLPARAHVVSILLDAGNAMAESWRRSHSLRSSPLLATAVAWAGPLVRSAGRTSPVLFFLDSRGCIASVRVGNIADSAIQSELSTLGSRNTRGCHD
jgi:hypothetical protein